LDWVKSTVSKEDDFGYQSILQKKPLTISSFCSHLSCTSRYIQQFHQQKLLYTRTPYSL
jgi:hypothetical protein